MQGLRFRRLAGGPYTFTWIGALTQKVREGGRTVNVHCLIATGATADGHRELRGVDVTIDISVQACNLAVAPTSTTRMLTAS